ncbi:hypothetical protein [Amycolatopsis plumensis]|uniref:DUF3558 domain-containing protein n=1 Tax=Amycolatopsis plumensis TaxID=236508 RepID=A0ABV5UGQ4_9PSEU
MERIRLVLAAVSVTACLAACTSPITTALPLLTPVTPVPPAAVAPPASPVKITAACPLFGPADLQQLLETSEDLMATEQPAAGTSGPGTEFRCRYEGKYVHPWLLDLWISSAADALPPEEAMKNIRKDCSGPVTAVPEAGEGAFFCDRTGLDQAEMVVLGKRSHGQNRVAVAYVLKHRKDVYARLAKLLAERL